MQPPMAPPPPPAAAPAKDNTTLFGVLGIILGLICCGPAGIVLGILSMQAAKKSGKPQTLGIVAIVAGVLNLVFGIVYYAAR